MNKFFNPIERLKSLDTIHEEAGREGLQLMKNTEEARQKLDEHTLNHDILVCEINGLRAKIRSTPQGKKALDAFDQEKRGS